MPFELFVRCFHARRKYTSARKATQGSLYTFNMPVIVKPILHTHIMQGVSRPFRKRFFVGVQRRIGLLNKVAQVDPRILFPVFGQKVIAKNIHNNSRKLSEFRPQCFFSTLNYRMSISEHIDLPVQANAFDYRF